jgi:hypothetical protein
VEALEDRHLLSTLTVLNASDSGPGSLRAALAQANPAGGDTIVFAPALNGQTIGLQSTLVIGKSVTIQGPGAGQLAVRRAAAGSFGVLAVSAGVTATVSGLTIANGSAGIGGGVYNQGNLTLTDCVVSANTATAGGGLFNDSGGKLTLIRDTVTGNTTGTFDGYGGGIFNQGAGLTVLDSAVVHNIAGAGDVGEGGGLYNNAVPVTLADCTIADNTAQGNFLAAGGGVFFNGPGAALVLSCTIAGNAAVAPGVESSYGGGLYVGAPLTLLNTIVAGNAAQLGTDMNGAVSTADNDLIGSPPNGNYSLPSNGLHNLTNTDPKLGALQDNGGPTPTMALLPGSPAIDAGSAAYLTNPPFGGPPFHDQAGRPRVVGLAPDIGAYEVQSRATAVALAGCPGMVVQGKAATFTATVTSPTGVPAGTVTFFIDGKPLATVALVNGKASFATAALTPGAHTIRATYNGFTVGDFALDPSSAVIAQFIQRKGRLT